MMTWNTNQNRQRRPSVETNPKRQRGSFPNFELFKPTCRSTSATSKCPLSRRRSWFATVCFAIFVGTATGQEGRAVAPLPPKPHVGAGQEADAQQPEDVPVAAEKMKKASAGIAAIAAIAILGIGAIAFTMIWARRLRRLARDPGPAQTTLGNDFWFLKPPKVITKESKIDISHVPGPPETPE